MRKATKKEEYMYLLGRACATADIYTLLHSVKPESRYSLVEEWVEMMKKLFENSDLWSEATNKIGEENV